MRRIVPLAVTLALALVLEGAKSDVVHVASGDELEERLAPEVCCVVIDLGMKGLDHAKVASTIEAWLPDGVPSMAADAARTELVRRWLGAFGPATASDVKWWTGWTVAQTKAALAAVRAVEVDLEAGAGWVLAGDEGPVRAPAPWVSLLPALDPTAMGWRERGWYLGDHGRSLFDTNGNAGPTVPSFRFSGTFNVTTGAASVCP